MESSVGALCGLGLGLRATSSAAKSPTIERIIYVLGQCFSFCCWFLSGVSSFVHLILWTCMIILSLYRQLLNSINYFLYIPCLCSLVWFIACKLQFSVIYSDNKKQKTFGLWFQLKFFHVYDNLVCNIESYLVRQLGHRMSRNDED